MTEPNITCTNCWMTSHNPNDVREGFCGNCHQFFPDGVVCRDPEHALDARFVHKWNNDDISVVVKKSTGAVALWKSIPAGELADYQNVLRVAAQESGRLLRASGAVSLR